MASQRKKSNVSLPEISEEVLIEILIRLPARSLMRFKCVSKLWLCLITSKYFTDLFLKLSPSRRRFFAYLADAGEESNNCAWFTSSSTHSFCDKSVSVISQDLTLPTMEDNTISSARGLACFEIGNRLRICNLHTRQVLELPGIESQVIRDNKWTYLGYNPVHDEYKVLRLACEYSELRLVKSEHHVLGLGAGASWKKIQCHILHTSFYSQEMTINGVLYYKGFTETHRCVLMSFDLTSEEFNLTEFPIYHSELWEIRIIRSHLINYQGKLALLDSMDVWVLEDAKKSQWSDKKSFVLPLSQFEMMGATTRSGQVWLINHRPPGTSFCFSIYDLERNEIIQSIKMSPSPGSFGNTLCFHLLDDIENIMYLET